MLVLQGDVEVEVAGVSYSLSAGDSISIQRNAPHRVVNAGARAAEILMVISPADTF
jgi:quercetin dioxygenase-like cupin family protein